MGKGVERKLVLIRGARNRFAGKPGGRGGEESINSPIKNDAFVGSRSHNGR